MSGDLRTWGPAFSLRPRAWGLGRSGAGTAGLHPALISPLALVTGLWASLPCRACDLRFRGGAEGGHGELCCLRPEV